jgi:hypothetical protein
MGPLNTYATITVSVSETPKHKGPPGTTKYRHTGDLGNVTAGTYTYLLEDLKVSELFANFVGKGSFLHHPR